jgi:hypothetical protein
VRTANQTEFDHSGNTHASAKAGGHDWLGRQRLEVVLAHAKRSAIKTYEDTLIMYDIRGVQRGEVRTE